jgi:hypothetical protein
MVDIRIIIFENSLKPAEIPYFRGAISKHLGASLLLHNHTQTGMRNALPLVQYKIINSRPAIVAINEGIAEVEPLFTIPEIKTYVGKRPIKLRVDSIWQNQFDLEITDQTFRYKLTNWLPLNEENYITYKETPSLVKRMEMLEQILTANILSFAKGVGVFYEQPVEVCLLDISEPKTAQYKNVKLLSFDVEFSCNIMLPEFIGLGKGVSKGFGVVNVP